MSTSRSPSPARSPSPTRSGSPIKRRQKSPSPSDSTCPFLIRLFVSKGKHAPMLDFDEGRFPVRDEFSAYGWKHSTPTSLIALLLPSVPAPYRSPAARYSFRHIYVDASQRGLYRNRDLISFTGRDLMATIAAESKPVNMDMELDDAPDSKASGRKVDEKTLDQYGYITGDLLSICVNVPEPRLPPVARTAGPVAGGRESFGWNERTNGAGAGAGAGAGSAGEKPWGRGEPLPSQGFRGRGNGRDEPAGGGSWRGGGPGMGIRGSGAGRRGSRSPPPVGRDGYERNGNGNGRRRSRSPDARDRRESWGRR